MSIKDRLAARRARKDSRRREALRFAQEVAWEPRVGYRCEFHRPKLYRYQVARVDMHGPLPWFRWPNWNAYRSPHGTARIGAAVVFGNWAYCVKWGNSRVVEVQSAALRDGGE